MEYPTVERVFETGKKRAQY